MFSLGGIAWSVMKVASKVMAQLVLFFTVLCLWLYYCDRQGPTIVADRWQGRVVVVGPTCFYDNNIYFSREVQAWCRDNGATEFIAVE